MTRIRTEEGVPGENVPTRSVGTTNGVRDHLIEQGFSDLEADEIIRRAVKQRRAENRRYGLLWLKMGVAIIVLGALILYLAIEDLLPAELRIYAFVGGGTLFLTGFHACLSGAIDVLFGYSPKRHRKPSAR